MASTHNTYYEHPKFQDFVRKYPETEEQAKLAFQVYIDLTEARGWWDVDLHYSERLRLVFVSGRPRKHEAKTLFVSVDVTQEVSPEQMHRFCEHIELANHSTHGITLAICDKDSSTTYFKVYNALVAPDPPEQTDVNKRKRASVAQLRRDHLHSEIRRYCQNQSAFEESNPELCDPDS